MFCSLPPFSPGPSLDTNYTVKVSDGALSLEFYPECYQAVYGTIRPVRWAAIETLQEGLGTSQSNVVSAHVLGTSHDVCSVLTRIMQ